MPPAGADFDEAARPKLLAKARLRYDDVRKQHVLLLPERAVMLSATAAEILGLCDGARTGGELIATLEGRYPGAALRADVTEFLGEAVKRRWIEWIAPA
jgi:pyrroloquinoline quinone biosynthesis protein D